MKKCSNCQEFKELINFSKDSSRGDGLRTKCRTCCSILNSEYQKNNRDAQNKKSKRWRENNPEKSRESVQKYRKANPLVSLRGNHEYRIRKKDATKHVVTQEDLNGLYSSPCAYCGSINNITVDHVVPLSRGGSHSIGNLLPACRSCNSSKGNKLLVEWMR